MSSDVSRLSRALEDKTLEFLARSPYEHAFLSWLIVNDRAPATRDALYTSRDRRGEVNGVAFFGRQVVLAGENGDALGEFARTARRYRFERMVVAPRASLEIYWPLVATWHAPPRIVRDHQPLLVVDAAHLRGGDRTEVVARRARPDEWDVVAQNSAAMIEHELSYDPRSAASDFNANVREMIARGLWWVAQERDGAYCFFCNSGPRTPATLQLQGIWTPPALRRRGLATAALHAVCAQILRDVPTVSLYVNDFNTAALALYDRTGFRRVGEFKTLLF